MQEVMKGGSKNVLLVGWINPLSFGSLYTDAMCPIIETLKLAMDPIYDD